jgi:hypothetical protein
MKEMPEEIERDSKKGYTLSQIQAINAQTGKPIEIDLDGPH